MGLEECPPTVSRLTPTRLRPVWYGPLFNVTLGVNLALTVQVVSGMQTPVLGANHPYYFYAQAEGFPAQAAAIRAMLQHEGTLFYPTGTPAVFTFKTSLAQGGSFCQSTSNNPCAS